MPKESTQKLLAHADNPYMLFIPVRAMQKRIGVYLLSRSKLKKWIAICKPLF